MIKKSTMAPVFGRVCTAHRLPIVLVLDLNSSGSETSVFMKLSVHLQQLSQHIIDVVAATCTQQPIGRAVSRASYSSEPRCHWLGLQSHK
jgi:hypothetical protein